MSIEGRAAKSQLIVGHRSGFTLVWRTKGWPEGDVLAASMTRQFWVEFKMPGLETIVKIMRSTFHGVLIPLRDDSLG